MKVKIEVEAIEPDGSERAYNNYAELKISGSLKGRVILISHTTDPLCFDAQTLIKAIQCAGGIS